MNLMRFALLLTAFAVPTATLADNVRVIEPTRHSMLPTGADDAKTASSTHADPSALKPLGRDVPSPILVERTATIDDAGNLVLGCGNDRRRDFRIPASVTPGMEASR